jgi:hypothetical protein
MKTFKTYLKEAKMTYDEALKIFGVQNGYTEEILKKKYKELAVANHPDKGGSTAKMQDINVANDLLKKNIGQSGNTISGTPSGGFDWAASNKKYKETAGNIIVTMQKNFVPKAFTEYFKKFSGLDFEAKITKIYPLEVDVEKAYSIHNAIFNVEFFTHDRETVFTLDASVYISDVVRGGLSSGDVAGEAPTSVIAFGFHKNRKQKMGQKDYKFGQSQAILSNPELTFPEAKMKKIFAGDVTGKFKKIDMEVGLQKKLNAALNGEYASLPISGNWKEIGRKDKDSYYLVIYRMLFNRTAFWAINGVYKGTSRISMMPTITLPENETTLINLGNLIDGAKVYKDNEQGLIEYLSKNIKTLK